MGRAKQFAANSFWLATSTVIIIFVGAIYRPIIGRILGPADFGSYNFITTFIGYFLIIALFGVRQVVAREIGRDPGTARIFLLKSAKIRAFTILVSMIACCLIGYGLNRGHTVTLGIFIMSISLAITGVGELLEGVLIALARSFYIAVSNLIGSLLRLGLGIWALEAGYGLIGVLWVFILTAGLSTVLNMVFTSYAIRLHKQKTTELAQTRYILKESIPFLVLSISTRLYAKSDILILTLLRGDKITGIYSAAYIFLDLLFAISHSITAVAYPMVTDMYVGSKGESEKSTADLIMAYERLHKYMVLGLIPISAILMSMGIEILMLVFGRQYTGGTSLLQVLVWTAPVNISANISGTFISAIYKQRLNTILATAGMIVNIIWTIIFIALYGAMGAAIATLGSAVVNTIVHYYFVTRTIGSPSLINTWLKPIICGVIMVGAIYPLMDSFWLLRGVIGISAYIIAIIIVRPFDAEDKRLVASVLTRKS
ncbi:MAG TPA: flippase [Armatimonadota bacterium]|nr:flippase [Armatimonadota bacterium]